MKPIFDYLQHGIFLTDNNKESRKIRIKALQYMIFEGMVYQKGFMMPWLRCVDKESGKNMLHQTHASTSGAHKEARDLKGKILRMGIYWPDIH